MDTEKNNQNDKRGQHKKPFWQKSGKKTKAAGRKPQNQKYHARNIYSAIDLGTNNCRLLVAQKTERGFKVIDSFSRVVRLGQGLSNNGTLSDEAIDRTIEALDICVAKIKRRGVTHMRNVATQACREATNCDAFVERVEKEVRIKLHIIDPAEEARLAVLGCKALLESTYSNAIVFDIGGGSTELIWVKIRGNDIPEIIDWISIPFGVVNLSEKYGTQEVISHIKYAQMRQDIVAAITSFQQKNNMMEMVALGKVQLLGTSGTITTLTAMHLELETYDRSRVDGASVKSSRIRELCQTLSVLDYDERAALKSIGADRADLVVAGCAILESIMDIWPIDDIKVADRGIREGMLLDMMDAVKLPRKRNNRRRKRRNRQKLNSKSGESAG